MTAPDRAALLARFGLDAEPDRLAEALTHRSRANEDRRGSAAADNQRLEFLGDAVLQLLASEALMAAHPTADEGELSRMRAALVKMDSLAAFGREIGLPAHLSLGRGAAASGEAQRDNVIADAVEAVVAAVYLHGGLDAARPLVASLLAGVGAAPLDSLDAKSALQEAVQRSSRLTPTYRTKAEEGPAHDKVFVVEVVAGDRVLGEGRGRSKKLAEQAAARAALDALSDEPPA